MIQVLQVTVFNLVVSYIVLKVGTGSGATPNVGTLLVSIFFGGLYLYSLWGLAAKWFSYEGDNVIIQWLWVASLLPMWQLALLFWILD